jgi:hypothetical protein
MPSLEAAIAKFADIVRPTLNITPVRAKAAGGAAGARARRRAEPQAEIRSFASRASNASGALDA